MLSPAILGFAPPSRDRFTSLTLHFEGIDGATQFTDVSRYRRTITRGGTATIKQDSAVFGSSLRLNGTTDFLSAADASELQLGAGDYTVELWARCNSIAAFAQLFTKGFTAAGGIYFQQNNTGAGEVGISGVSIFGAVAGMFAADGVFHHYAVERLSGTAKLYKDGVSQASAADATNLNNSGSFFIGQNASAGDFFNGWISEFRLSKGIARFRGSFRPPAQRYQ